MATRYGNRWNVIGGDLFNEPWGVSKIKKKIMLAIFSYHIFHFLKIFFFSLLKFEKATWGAGNSATDWDKGASKFGQAIQEVAPHWLLFVEGVAGGCPYIYKYPYWVNEF